MSKNALKATFNMKYRGRLRWFPVLRIKREEDKVTVNKERRIEKMLEQFQVDDCEPSRTPAGVNLKHRQHRTETKKGTGRSTEDWLDHFCIWPNRRGQTSCSCSQSTYQHWLCRKRLMQKKFKKN